MTETSGMPATEEVLDLPEGEMVDSEPPGSLADALEEVLDAIADEADTADAAPADAERREQVRRKMRETEASNTARKMGLKDAHLK